MIVTVQKYTFVKEKSKVILYRCHKTFNNNLFSNELKERLSHVTEYVDFDNTYVEVLNSHPPIKKKLVRDHAPYMSKVLRKAIMKRSNLENKYRNNSTSENREIYRKHKNYCSRLYKKERKKYYAKLDLKNITDSKRFWNTIKPFLTGKGVNSQNSHFSKVIRFYLRTLMLPKHSIPFSLTHLRVLVLMKTHTL